MAEMVHLDRAECLELLRAGHFGRLAVNVKGAAPAIRPVNYVFDARSQSVVFRTGVGSKLHGLRTSTKAAFEIDGVDDSSHAGWSVILVGVSEAVTSPAECRRLDELGLETWAPGDKPQWVRIRAGTVSGRRIVPAT